MPRALLAIIAVAASAGGWIAIDRVFGGDALPNGTSDFVAGHGVAYSSPDRTFDAQFPIAPTVHRKRISVAAGSANINLAQAQTDSYEIVAASMVMPGAIPASQIDAALHEVLEESMAGRGGTIVSEERVVRNGVQGIEVQAKVPDGYPARFTILLSGSRVYLLGVHAKHGTEKLYDALVASLNMH